MFGFLKSLFRPPSQQEIKDATGRKLYNIERRRRMKTIPNNEKLLPNNGTGRAVLSNITKEEHKMTKMRLDELLKRNNLSTSARPSIRVNKSDNTKRVTFTVPFLTLNKLTSARIYLNSIKNEQQNRGQFKNIEIVNVNKSNTNNSTLKFTLSSSKNMTIPIPQHFVEKIYGVDVPLFKKSKVKKEDLVNWSKYRRVGENIKYVKDLIDVSEFFETKPLQKLYGPTGPWQTYGDRVALKVEEMRRVLDPKNIPKILGTTYQQSNALELQLSEVMTKYIELEKRVFKSKTRIDVQQRLYKEYIGTQSGNPNENKKNLPKVCNIPSNWKATWMKNAKNNKNTNNQDSVPIKQLFRTIGSIRYPDSDKMQCPLTKRNDVWQYEFNRRRRNNNAIDSNDSWLKLLYEREGYVETLKIAHEHIDFLLNELVEYYKMKVQTERIRQNAKNNSRKKSLDIELAWELYDICNKCKLNEHPMFRVCAGFKVLNSPNPEDSQFMDRFRYMVHNKPQKEKRSESVNDDVKYVLTQSDLKYFFMSSDLYDNSKYMIKKVEYSNSNSNSNVIYFKSDKCSTRIKMSLLERGKPAKSGFFFLAWPTLHDASEYYK